MELITSSNNLLGDLNDDGTLNVLDVIVMVNIALELDEPSNVSDLNDDGLTNILDVIILVNQILEG